MKMAANTMAFELSRNYLYILFQEDWSFKIRWYLISLAKKTPDGLLIAMKKLAYFLADRARGFCLQSLPFSSNPNSGGWGETHTIGITYLRLPRQRVPKCV